MITADQGVAWAVQRIGQRIDADGVYGSQCMDLTVQFCRDNFSWHPTGNAIRLTDQAIPAGWQRIRNTDTFIPQDGDIAIWGLGAYALYGHTGVIVGPCDMSGFTSVDQNWFNASLISGSPAAGVRHNYNGFWGVLRPPYNQKEENMGKPQDTIIDKDSGIKLLELWRGPGKSSTEQSALDSIIGKPLWKAVDTLVYSDEGQARLKNLADFNTLAAQNTQLRAQVDAAKPGESDKKLAALKGAAQTITDLLK